jgi:hypothetical protein
MNNRKVKDHESDEEVEMTVAKPTEAELEA